MNLLKLYRICEDKDDMLENLRSWGLLPFETFCPKCEQPLTLYNNSMERDGFRWVCKNKRSKKGKCGKIKSFRGGTFFSRSQLSILQILGFVNLWVQNVSLKVVKEQLDMGSDNTVVNWASYCREVLLTAFLKSPEKIGGAGKVVEIVESKFDKRVYHRGQEVEWVFGGYEWGSGRLFMVSLDSSDRESLLSVIEKWVEHGSTVYSECWKTYDCLSSEAFKELEAKHSFTFLDRETGTQTSLLESSLRRARNCSSSKAKNKKHMPGNLARYIFYRKCDELKLDRTLEFYRLAGEIYNPNNRETVETLAIEVVNVDEMSVDNDDMADLMDEINFY